MGGLTRSSNLSDVVDRGCEGVRLELSIDLGEQGKRKARDEDENRE